MLYGICMYKIGEPHCSLYTVFSAFHSSFLAAPLTVTEELALNEEIYSLPATALSITRLFNVCVQDETAAFP